MKAQALTPQQTFALMSTKQFDPDDNSTVTVRQLTWAEISEFTSKYDLIVTEATDDGIRVYSETNPLDRILELLYLGIADFDLVDEDGESMLKFSGEGAKRRVKMSRNEFKTIFVNAVPASVRNEIAARIIEVNPTLGPGGA